MINLNFHTGASELNEARWNLFSASTEASRWNPFAKFDPPAFHFRRAFLCIISIFPYFPPSELWTLGFIGLSIDFARTSFFPCAFMIKMDLWFDRFRTDTLHWGERANSWTKPHFFYSRNFNSTRYSTETKTIITEESSIKLSKSDCFCMTYGKMGLKSD